MNPLPHRSAGIRLGIACAALLAASAVAARAEEVTKSFAVSGRANVRVETNDGSVRVTSDDSKQVEFRVEYQGYELGKNLRVDSRQSGDKVELTARVTGRWDSPLAIIRGIYTLRFACPAKPTSRWKPATDPCRPNPSMGR